MHLNYDDKPFATGLFYSSQYGTLEGVEDEKFEWRNKLMKNKTTSLNKNAGSPASASGEFQIGGDLPVYRLGFGTMRITGKGIWGEPNDPQEAIRVLRRAIDLGVNFIDTADSYGPNVSERFIAEALYPYPADLVIATKGGFTRPGPDQWTVNAQPEHLREACEGSLRRLRLDRIDLYQLHRIDTEVPVAEQLGVLQDMQAEGKIRHIGLSEVGVRQIAHARTIVPIVSVQNRYSLSDRSAENVVDYCERENIGFIPWFPLAAGKLTASGGALNRAAAEFGVTMSQLALAWLLWRSPVMLPIPGTSSVRHLEENVEAAELNLGPAKLYELGMAVASA
jgi:pyridoxine 4-dehydrogenase